MPKGGKREGAGRPLKGSSPAIARTIRVNNEDWQLIQQLAKNAGLSVTQYIIKSAIPQKNQKLSNSGDGNSSEVQNLSK